MRGRLAAVAIVALGLAGLGVGAPACVWTTGADVSDLGTKTCTFQGSDTECGKCVVSSCQDQINAVCKAGIESDGGGNVLTYLDACASGSDSTQCSNIARSGIDDSSSALVTCLSTQCAMDCTLGPQMLPSTCGGASLPDGDCAACILGTCSPQIGACCAMADRCGATLVYLSSFIGDCVQMQEPCPAACSDSCDSDLISCAAQCKSCMAQCVPSGESCSGGEACCEGICQENGKCGACGNANDACVESSDCCSGNCDYANGSVCD